MIFCILADGLCVCECQAALFLNPLLPTLTLNTVCVCIFFDIFHTYLNIIFFSNASVILAQINQAICLIRFLTTP